MRWISIFSGALLAAIVTFAAGMWTTHKRWQPWLTIESLLPFARAYRDTGMFLPMNSYFPRSDASPEVRYTVFRPEDISPGYLFIARVDAGLNATIAELLDRDGAVVHSWILRTSGVDDAEDRYSRPCRRAACRWVDPGEFRRLAGPECGSMPAASRYGREPT